MQELSIVGKRLPLKDAAEKVTGRATFTRDIKLPGMLYAKILRSPYPHARVLRVDATEAAQFPGVKAVLCHNNAPALKLPVMFGEPRDRYAFDEKVRYAGEEVAIVVAGNEKAAEEALKLIKVDYKELPAVLDLEEAVKPGAPLIHEDKAGNIAFPIVITLGDVEAGFAEADHIFEETFKTQSQRHASMETHCCVASFDPAGNLTIWVSHQAPHALQELLAEYLDMPASKIRVIKPYMGGGFGKGDSFRAEPICIALAQKTGKPVKMEYTREEEFIATESRQPFIQTGKIGAKKDGTITALQTKIITHAGAYFTHSSSTTTVNMGFFTRLYRCSNIAGEADIVYTNTPVSAGMRGYGNPQAMWVLEQLVDMAAERIGMDPVEFRLKNYVRPNDPGILSMFIESCALDECVRLGTEKISWKKKRMRKKEGVTRRGVGAAIMRHASGSYPSNIQTANAFIKLSEDGSAGLVIDPCEVGQGILGAMGQIAAEELGLRADDVHIISGDTDVLSTPSPDNSIKHITY